MLINVFAVSLFLILALIAIKLWEKESGRQMFVSKFFSKGDAYILDAKAKLELSLHDNKRKTIFFLLFHLPERIELFFRELKKKAHDRYYHLDTKMRGKKALSGTGDISPFMRNITPRDSDR